MAAAKQKNQKRIKSILKAIKNNKEKTTLGKAEQKKDSPYRVLITTVLSQRNRDKSTEIAARNLFSRYKTIKQISSAKNHEIERLIIQSGFYRIKAERIKKISAIILDKYHGKVPSSVDELVKLPGVGRKTANCVLVYGFQKPAIPVDVHVHRISNRLGLVNTNNPEKTEKALILLIPKRYWLQVNESFVNHGKNVCRPINPLCKDCKIKMHCDYFNKLKKQ